MLLFNPGGQLPAPRMRNFMQLCGRGGDTAVPRGGVVLNSAALH